MKESVLWQGMSHQFKTSHFSSKVCQVYLKIRITRMKPRLPFCAAVGSTNLAEPWQIEIASFWSMWIIHLENMDVGYHETTGWKSFEAGYSWIPMDTIQDHSCHLSTELRESWFRQRSATFGCGHCWQGPKEPPISGAFWNLNRTLQFWEATMKATGGLPSTNIT